MKVTGKLGSFSSNADGDFRVNHFSNVSVSTDKPLYQPGQALHARLMAFDINKKAIASESVILKILDPEETLVYRTELQTSRFGIAAADWQIPDNLRLGTYRIQANFGKGRYEDSGASASVRISRYELPSFTVTAKPDRTYYLPDQNASIEIRADYLFGEPVQISIG
jgi:CD109 antigen